MKFSSFAILGLAGLLTLGQNPAMSVAPDLAPPAGTQEILDLRFSTQNQRGSCVRRGSDCTFRPRDCCAGNCKNTTNNGKVCR
jgi:hypothetical protein